MSRCNDLDKEEIVVAMILAHVGQIEPRFQRNIFSEEINTRCKMSRELMAFSYNKRSFQECKTNNNNITDLKRPRLSTTLVKCYKCGKFGHKSFECFSQKAESKIISTSIRSDFTARPPVTCFKLKMLKSTWRRGAQIRNELWAVTQHLLP